MEPISLAGWLDIVGNLHPLGQIEFCGFLEISLMVSCVNEEESLDAIAAVQLYQLPSDAWPVSVLSVLLVEYGLLLSFTQPATVLF